MELYYKKLFKRGLKTIPQFCIKQADLVAPEAIQK